MATCTIYSAMFSYYHSCDRITTIVSSIIFYILYTDLKPCPSGWSTSLTSRSCIKPYKVLKMWTAARIECQAHGGDLFINYEKEKEDLICGIVLLHDKCKRLYFLLYSEKLHLQFFFITILNNEEYQFWIWS